MPATRRYDEISGLWPSARSQNISVFELKRLADNYIIQGVLIKTGSLPSKVRSGSGDA